MRLCLSLLICFFVLGVAFAQDEPTGYEIALERIVLAERMGHTELNLSGLQLTEVPLGAFNLRQLESLNLSGNLLTSLPPEIRYLSNLKTLYLAFNSLTSLS